MNTTTATRADWRDLLQIFLFTDSVVLALAAVIVSSIRFAKAL